MADHDLGKGSTSVDLAYSRALKSYEVAQSRFDLMNGRIQVLMVLFVTLYLAFPATIAALGSKLHPGWLTLASLVFIAAVIIGTCSVLGWAIKTTNPGGLYEHFLDLSPTDFKKNSIRFAGKSFDLNTRAIEKKRILAIAMASCFAAALVLMIAGAVFPSDIGVWVRIFG